jgi:CoA-transferase family III
MDLLRFDDASVHYGGTAMDLTERLSPASAPVDPDALWAASGAMALTGRHDGRPLLAPPRVASDMSRWAAAAGALATAIGTPFAIDGPALLGERAAVAGLARAGDRSAGGATRLLRAADGWIAVALARPDDIAAVPAWLDRPVPGDVWSVVRDAVAAGGAQELVERACLLDVPCARLGEVVAGEGVATASALGSGPPCRSLRDVVVVDLSSLWAGPLCTNLLQQAGAGVVKVESRARPDGARQGMPAFFDLLNAGKESVALDLPSAPAVDALVGLLRRADVVIEASRPRALAQLGIDVREIAAAGRLRVWLSITGHGRDDGAATRVAFGDDAAVAGGLVAWDADQPCFCADAVADPASGLLAAAAVLDRLAAGGQWHVDVALARTAAHLARQPATAPPWPGAVALPRARPARGPGPPLGEHNQLWLGAGAR